MSPTGTTYLHAAAHPPFPTQRGTPIAARQADRGAADAQPYTTPTPNATKAPVDTFVPTGPPSSTVVTPTRGSVGPHGPPQPSTLLTPRHPHTDPPATYY